MCVCTYMRAHLYGSDEYLLQSPPQTCPMHTRCRIKYPIVFLPLCVPYTIFEDLIFKKLIKPFLNFQEDNNLNHRFFTSLKIDSLNCSVCFLISWTFCNRLIISSFNTSITLILARPFFNIKPIIYHIQL